MPVRWNLKQWLAVERQIYRPSELQTVLEEKTETQLSLQAISSLLNNIPSALRLSTIQALCNALNCTLDDFCQVLPDQSTTEEQQTDAAQRSTLHKNQDQGANKAHIKPGIDAAIRDIVMQTLAELGLIPSKQEQ